jgi:hypothetical protein
MAQPVSRTPGPTYTTRWDAPKELERENSRLKKIVADQALEIEGLREIARGNW